VRGLGAFLYDFVIGDDWRIAAGVVALLLVGGVAIAAGVTTVWLGPLLALGFMAVYTWRVLAR
jgi:hypothetical protein